MDTITQMTLGAAVGELTLGKKEGNKAVLWGAVGGCIPDLDMLMAPFLDPVSQLLFHRGFTHSVTFAVLFAPLLAWIIFKIYKGQDATFRDWTKLAFWSIITHPILDIFTSYGTEFFWPFSDYRFALSSIFVIDPLYSLPFLLSVILLMFYHRSSSRRRLINYLGIGLSSLYLLITVGNKFYVNSVFARNLKDQHIEYLRFMSAPTPFNNILWRAIAETKTGYVEGYYSLLDGNSPVRFQFIEKNHQLLEGLQDRTHIQKLVKFTKNYYKISEENGVLYLNDLRYGRLNGWGVEGSDYVFRFKIMNPSAETEADMTIMRDRPHLKIDQKVWLIFFRRILGQ